MLWKIYIQIYKIREERSKFLKTNCFVILKHNILSHVQIVVFWRCFTSKKEHREDQTYLSVLPMCIHCWEAVVCISKKALSGVHSYSLTFRNIRSTASPVLFNLFLAIFSFTSFIYRRKDARAILRMNSAEPKPQTFERLCSVVSVASLASDVTNEDPPLPLSNVR